MSRKNYNRDYSKPKEFQNKINSEPVTPNEESIPKVQTAEEPVVNPTTEIKIEDPKPIAVPAAEDEVSLETVEEAKLLKTENVTKTETPFLTPAPMGTVVATRNVYLREKATMNCDKLGVVTKGTLIDILDVPNASWYQVETELGAKGFVMALYTEELS